MSYQRDSRALDAEILGVIDAWHRRGERLGEAEFNELALRIFAYQLRYNQPYARYCSRLGVTSPPDTWEAIPAVPAAAFKETALTTFDPAAATLVFETSGTSGGAGGLHYMEGGQLYDAALLAGFDRCVLADGPRLRYLNLVPNPAERPRSSLGYMMARVAEQRGSAGWYVRGDRLLFDAFAVDLREAIAAAQPVCIAATAFALVNLLDAMAERRVRWTLPKGSRVMETGGFKGRARAVRRDEFYALVSEGFGIGVEAIVAEYGMTELSSQYYASGAAGFTGPPWLRARVVAPDRTTLPPGETGSLLHVDLANRSSCVAIQTEDIGLQTPAGFVLLGRAANAPARGCSLDAEELRATSPGGAR